MKLFIRICILLIFVITNVNIASADGLKLGPFQLRTAASIKAGYENNVQLDSSRKGDMFTEAAVFTEGEYKISKNVGLGVEYDLIAVLYSEFTRFDFMDNEGRAFVKYYLDNNWWIKAGYLLGMVWYPHDKDGTYTTYGPLLETKYYINRDLYLQCGYEYTEYDYDKRKKKDHRNVTLETTRQDDRHVLRFAVGKYFKDLLIKVSEKIDFNESNDEFMDFYDYMSYRTSIFAGLPLFKKFYVSGYASFRIKDFDSRKTLDLSEVEEQKTYSAAGSIYYKLYKDVYISSTYTYTQNESNEPLNEFSESIISAGLQVMF